ASPFLGGSLPAVWAARPAALAKTNAQATKPKRCMRFTPGPRENVCFPNQYNLFDQERFRFPSTTSACDQHPVSPCQPTLLIRPRSLKSRPPALARLHLQPLHAAHERRGRPAGAVAARPRGHNLTGIGRANILTKEDRDEELRHWDS